MIDPQNLLSISNELTTTNGRGAPQQAKLRRAISTSYYALFHFLIRNATDLLVGPTQRNTPRYGIIYRSFEHAQMRTVSENVSKSNMPAAYTRALGTVSFGNKIRSCAATFVELQALRHEADYDPAKRVALTDAKATIANAKQAMSNFDAASTDEKNLFLTMLGFKLRA
ncbi:MAG: hypothetical protein WA138_05845 [Parvibaculum sp.]